MVGVREKVISWNNVRLFQNKENMVLIAIAERVLVYGGQAVYLYYPVLSKLEIQN